MNGVTLLYSSGSIVLDDLNSSEDQLALPQSFFWDTRTKQWRAEAWQYRFIIEALRKRGVSYHDHAKSYEKLQLKVKKPIAPRPHQSQALNAWMNCGGRGVVSLPTGAGKTILSLLAMEKIQRPTLVVVPTIDLMRQWQSVITEHFGEATGLLGGGDYTIADITIATYDSAAIHCEKIGALFGFVVFDECHHLPAPQYQFISRCLIAPFRLGLSATVQRADGKEELIYQFLGDLCFEGHIHEMPQKVLAPYQVINVQVPMTQSEYEDYKSKRKVYTDFLRRARIDMSSHDGWSRFVFLSSRSEEGRRAMRCYREQKRLAQASTSKIEYLWNILKENQGERIIIFTDENSLAYQIGERFVLPVLTHHTKVSERKRILESFKIGLIDVLVTSKVLNEGVDVPDASVGIVVSGSGAVREHVQRLGRILRHKDGKTAKLYEIISKGTSEAFVNARRKQHYAYQRPTQI